MCCAVCCAVLFVKTLQQFSQPLLWLCDREQWLDSELTPHCTVTAPPTHTQEDSLFTCVRLYEPLSRRAIRTIDTFVHFIYLSEQACIAVLAALNADLSSFLHWFTLPSEVLEVWVQYCLVCMSVSTVSVCCGGRGKMSMFVRALLNREKKNDGFASSDYGRCTSFDMHDAVSITSLCLVEG